MVTYNGTVYYYVTNLQGDVVVTHRTAPVLNVLNATELLNNKCGNGNWKPGAALDFNQIVKRINRSLKAVALIMPDMFME